MVGSQVWGVGEAVVRGGGVGVSVGGGVGGAVAVETCVFGRKETNRIIWRYTNKGE